MDIAAAISFMGAIFTFGFDVAASTLTFLFENPVLLILSILGIVWRFIARAKNTVTN